MQEKAPQGCLISTTNILRIRLRQPYLVALIVIEGGEIEHKHERAALRHNDLHPHHQHIEPSTSPSAPLDNAETSAAS